MNLLPTANMPAMWGMTIRNAPTSCPTVMCGIEIPLIPARSCRIPKMTARPILSLNMESRHGVPVLAAHPFRGRAGPPGVMAAILARSDSCPPGPTTAGGPHRKNAGPSVPPRGVRLKPASRRALRGAGTPLSVNRAARIAGLAPRAPRSPVHLRRMPSGLTRTPRGPSVRKIFPVACLSCLMILLPRTE